MNRIVLARYVLPSVVVLTSGFVAFADIVDGYTGLFAKDLTPLWVENVSVSADREIVLADDGSAMLPIVYEDDDRGGFAAGYLSSVLEEMCGVEFGVYRIPDGATNSFDRCVYISRPDNGDDFQVVVSGCGIRFSGRSDYAVYDFCERILGVRHYWDGDDGRSVIRKRRIAIPVLGYSDSPVFSFRRYSARGNPAWLRVAKGGGTFDCWARCHTTDSGFCYGSPEGLCEYCRRVSEDIAGGTRFLRVVDRDRKTVSVSPCDEEYGCGCKWCRTLKRHRGFGPGTASTVLWDRFLPGFARYMAEHHPDYRVCVLPYWNYVMPPCTNVDLGTNVYAEVCSMSGLAAFKWDIVRDREEGIILDWERVTGRKVASWHYSCWPAEYTVAPYVYGHTIASHYRRMRDHTVGSFICGGKDDFPRFSISLYIWMRCLWNPEIDVESVYDEFCARQFGPAAAVMREVIRIQESDWDPTTFAFSMASHQKLADLLTSAARLVRGTSAESAFITYLSGFSGAFELRR